MDGACIMKMVFMLMEMEILMSLAAEPVLDGFGYGENVGLTE